MELFLVIWIPLLFLDYYTSKIFNSYSWPKIYFSTFPKIVSTTYFTHTLLQEKNILLLICIILIFIFTMFDIYIRIKENQMRKNTNNISIMLKTLDTKLPIYIASIYQYREGLYSYQYISKVINYLIDKKYISINCNFIKLNKKIPFNIKIFIYSGFIKKTPRFFMFTL